LQAAKAVAKGAAKPESPSSMSQAIPFHPEKRPLEHPAAATVQSEEVHLPFAFPPPRERYLTPGKEALMFPESAIA
jgi:hypothetical protein